MKLSGIQTGWKYPDEFPPKEFWIEPKIEKNNIETFHDLVLNNSGEKK